jgi:hypothetical protein
VTWCSTPVGDAEIEYVRADLAAPVEITDEMVEAACNAFLSRWSAHKPDEIDDDARSAISSKTTS